MLWLGWPRNLLNCPNIQNSASNLKQCFEPVSFHGQMERHQTVFYPVAVARDIYLRKIGQEVFFTRKQTYLFYL